MHDAHMTVAAVLTAAGSGTRLPAASAEFSVTPPMVVAQVAHPAADDYRRADVIVARIPERLRALAAQLHAWPITASGTEGYRTAEVTLGGVDTDEISSTTMESRRLPGLYFIGEVVDVTGLLGGYNFQWAWASGHAAGLAV